MYIPCMYVCTYIHIGDQMAKIGVYSTVQVCRVALSGVSDL